MDAKIELSGKTTSDLVYALEEVKRLIENGCTSGTNRNDTGRFYFDITGEDPSESED
jgi:hypothetical protein